MIIIGLPEETRDSFFPLSPVIVSSGRALVKIFLDLWRHKGYNIWAYSKEIRRMMDFSEVNVINRQKFLAELAKLLTFMYEEDRQYAMSMYERMFDIAEDDEQWLIQHLMSPTRQAVVIARAYDAKERKLSVSSQSKDEDNYEEEEGTPPFVLAINKIFDDLFPEETEIPEPVEDQVSFFELGEISEEEEQKKPRMPKAATLLSNTQEFTLDLDALPNPEEESEPATVESETEAETEESENEEMPESAEADSDEFFSDPVAEIKKILSESIPEETTEVTPEETVAEIPIESETAPESVEEISSTPETEEDSVDEVQPDADTEVTEPTEISKVDKADNSEESESVPVTDEAGLAESESFAEPEEESSVEQAETAEGEAKESDEAKEPSVPETEPEESLTLPPENEAERIPDEKLSKGKDPVIPSVERKKWARKSVPTERAMNTPLLILFLIVAIPVTLVLLALLLIPALVSMVAAVCLCALGAVLVVSAFSGFAVLADILLLLGSAIAMLALGLLLLWLAVWLIGSVMRWLVGSVREQAIRWCSREVPAE